MNNEVEAPGNGGTVQLQLDTQIEKYTRILKDNPDDLSALMSYAEANLRRGKRLAALSAYQRVAHEKPETLEAHLALAKIYFIQNFHDAAFQELKHVFELDPLSVEGHILYREMAAKLETAHQWAEGREQFLSHQLRERDVRLYHRQLEIEQWQLGVELSEMEEQLAAKPDTILEYHRNTAIKQREAIKNLMNILDGLAPTTMEEKPESVKLEASLPPAAEPSAPPTIGPFQDLQDLRPAAALSAQEEAAVTVPGPKKVLSMTEISPILESIKKTRGVLGIFIISTSGEVLFADGSLTSPSTLNKDITALIISIINTVYAVPPSVASASGGPAEGGGICDLPGAGSSKSSTKRNLVYWVAEYEQGLMVLAQITSTYDLVILGDKGVNFGAIRLALDKGRKPLANILEK